MTWTEPESRIERIGEGIAILIGIVVLVWAIELIDVLLPVNLDSLGIRPRRLWSLPRIVIAPFLHVGFSHVAANTVPFIVLGGLTMTRGIRTFFTVSAIAALSSGLAIWLMGRANSVHLGLSGVIFGYLGYLLFRAFVDRKPSSILIMIVVLALFSGTLWGLVPGQRGVSWLGHFFGFLGGIAAAVYLGDDEDDAEIQRSDQANRG
ncbi:MAG: rhomboid family intramembrane serine protease [Actinobacteria bacterium]|nr:rhomboid family intramembrane serine protease [Actinomycetota bacterium]MCB9390521.1 rhomboid family intramembrane serine protease [Acidimicrobiia bacterium]